MRWKRERREKNGKGEILEYAKQWYLDAIYECLGLRTHKSVSPQNESGGNISFLCVCLHGGEIDLGTGEI